MDFLQGWAGLILGFSGLIFIHELGHFVLAKWNGVRVYVFSLGMGPYLVSFTWRGTVYALSLIPIGGYVKLAGQDDSNLNLPPSQAKDDYRNKRPGQKAAILAAGAIFNLIFAVAAFTLCYRLGLDIEPPRIGNILPDKPLAQAVERVGTAEKSANLQKGDLILEVNGVPVKTFLEAQLQISATAPNEDLWLKVERQPLGGGLVSYVVVKTRHDKRYGASSIGLEPYIYKSELPLGFTTEDSVVVLSTPKQDMPAALAGLQKDDEILRVTDATDAANPRTKNIRDAEDFINVVRGSNGHVLTLAVRRKGEEKNIEITPRHIEDSDAYLVGAEVGLARRRVSTIDTDSEAYKAGLRENNFVLRFEPDNPNAERWRAGKLVWQEAWGEKQPQKSAHLTVDWNDPVALKFLQPRRAVEIYQLDSLSAAIGTAWDDTVRFSGSVFGVLRGLVTGSVETKALSGPTGIAGLMYTVARNQTFLNYLWFLGFISLNLGMLQFVPIPLLDGFHLLMVAVEKLKGSPVAPKIQEAFQYVGIFIVGGLLILATYNDLRRIFLP